MKCSVNYNMNPRFSERSMRLFGSPSLRRTPVLLRWYENAPTSNPADQLSRAFHSWHSNRRSRPDQAPAIAQLVHRQPPVELRQAFMDVVACNMQRRSHNVIIPEMIFILQKEWCDYGRLQSSQFPTRAIENQASNNSSRMPPSRTTQSGTVISI